jgi:DNA-binding ferritin-like protein
MPTPEELQATVEQLNEEQWRELLYLLRRRFHWYVEMFDFEDG